MDYSQYLINLKTMTDLADSVRSLTHSSSAFTPAQMMSAIENYQPKIIPVLAHYSDQTITSVYDDCDMVGNYAYRVCMSLTTVDLPKCQILGLGAFEHASALQSISLPECRQIYGYALGYNSSSLSSIDLPKCTYIGSGAFNMDSALTSISIPNVEYIGGYAFGFAMSMSSVTFFAPKCSCIVSCFVSCLNLVVASLPVCTYIEGFAFNNCINLTDIYLDKVSQVTTLVDGGNSCFTNCTNLTSIHVPARLYSNFLADSAWALYSDKLVST